MWQITVYLAMLVIRYCYIDAFNLQQLIIMTGPNSLSNALLEEWRRLEQLNPQRYGLNSHSFGLSVDVFFSSLLGFRLPQM